MVVLRSVAFGAFAASDAFFGYFWFRCVWRVCGVGCVSRRSRFSLVLRSVAFGVFEASVDTCGEKRCHIHRVMIYHSFLDQDFAIEDLNKGFIGKPNGHSAV